ncbi:Uma2 family endonuclease [Laspinema sp. A4]|uniref:Uma2 family endonuclease n=1 Tax=Laspinema sp. D2d TaxID=2953686 RepID=UPI0021BA80E0|nr:Uma2 family endonuclease [Laspinema sp. D2d]MCT7982674.1 Uma2 family endonuclease [Laspinema sp. D2d]
MNLATAFISVPDYFKQEETSPIRHEYLGGQLFAMAGASEEHNRISGNIYAYLLTHLRGSGCKTFMSDMKIKIQVAQGTGDIFYYPDVLVTCDEEDRDKFYKTQPCLVVEVLSPSTETIDRREKRLNYQSLTSLQEYVLVAQDQMQVEVYRRKASGNWEVERLGPNDSLELNSVGLTLTLAEIYDEVFAG